MRLGFLPSVTHRAWWWVFGLFIATPAVALALLGLQAIRAGEIEHEQRVREEQEQLAALADASLAGLFDRVGAESETAVDGSFAFEIDGSGVIAFPRDRVYFGPFGEVPSAAARSPLPTDVARVVDEAQSADAQGQHATARALYERLRARADFAAWAGLRLAALDVRSGDRAKLAGLTDAQLAVSNARTPSDIPLALAASSLSAGAEPSDRHLFAPLLSRTLTELHAGRWWLSSDQRRAYDAELRRWLAAADPSIVPTGDTRLAQVSALETVVREANEKRTQARADFVRGPEGGSLIVWSQATAHATRRSGVVVVGRSVNDLFAATIDPLLAGHAFRTVLRDRANAAVRGNLEGATEWQSLSLKAVDGWRLAFTRPDPPPTGRLLSYATVLLPVIVLGAGLVMTVWIVRRDVALARMQSMFVASVTHEFKSPITSIRLLMERLSSGHMRPGDSPDRYYAAIGAEADRLEGLVNRLLESQKLQSGQKEYAFQPGSLEALTRIAIDRLRSQFEAKKIQVDLRVAGAIPDLPLDRESMTDAIGNLIDNAVKYSPNGTGVTVAVGTSDGVVQLDVCDEGIGVDPSDTTRIFDPFYRSRRGDHQNVHGTGLGLSLVKAAVEAHGGSVAVERNGSRGSRFRVRLPVKVDA